MSTSSDTNESSGREVAKRLFAREFNDATYTFKESDDELAPNYTLIPTGARVNRLFFAGTLTETNDVGSESEYWQGRVVDPTGTFYVYAGQYQPEAANTLRQIETPTYVTVVGKPRSYETDDGEMNVAVRPESITQVDEPTRDRWVVETADQTIERLQAFDNEINDYAQMARDKYGEMLSPYREAAVEALESLDATEADTETDTTADTPATNSESKSESESVGEGEDAQSAAADSDSFATRETDQTEADARSPDETIESDVDGPDELSDRDESEDTALGGDE